MLYSYWSSRNQLQNRQLYLFALFAHILLFTFSKKTPVKDCNFSISSLYSLDSIYSAFQNSCYQSLYGDFDDFAMKYSEFQYFHQLGINTTESKDGCLNLNEPTDIILSPGQFIGNSKPLKNLLQSPFKKRMLVLPTSIRNCDTIVQMFDENDTIILRDFESYEYCIKLNNRSKFFVSNDMELSLDLSKVNFNSANQNLQNESLYPNQMQYLYIRYSTDCEIIRNMMNNTWYTYENKSIRFYFRRSNKKVKSFDLSRTIFLNSAESTGYISLCFKLLVSVIDSTDVVVTDSSIFGIMAFLLGKEVYLFDSRFHITSSVYSISLASSPRVHLVKKMRDLPFMKKKKLQSGQNPSSTLLNLWNLSYYQFCNEIFHNNDLQQMYN